MFCIFASTGPGIYLDSKASVEIMIYQHLQDKLKIQLLNWETLTNLCQEEEIFAAAESEDKREEIC